MKKDDKFYCIKELYRDSCGYPLVIGKVYEIEKIFLYNSNMSGIIVKNPHFGEKKVEIIENLTKTTIFQDWMFYDGFNDDIHDEFFDYFCSFKDMRKLKLNEIKNV